MKGDSILYVQTSDNPERQYSLLVLAQTAKAMDIEAKVYYLGQGLRILKPGAATLNDLALEAKTTMCF